MSTKDILKKLPSGGLLKISAERSAPITREKRAALIRKGNELYNKGELALAQRIFVTTKYSDGLIRIGDRYLKGGKPLDTMLKEARIWGSRQSLFKRALQRIDDVTANSALAHSAKIDRMIKGIGTGDVWNEFLRLGLSLGSLARPGVRL